MIVIPPDEFMMGSADTERATFPTKAHRTVRILQTFAVAKFDVMFAEWRCLRRPWRLRTGVSATEA
jgi:formylglycine-generating enzyme required for sulfatase activity